MRVVLFALVILTFSPGAFAASDGPSCGLLSRLAFKAGLIKPSSDIDSWLHARFGPYPMKKFPQWIELADSLPFETQQRLRHELQLFAPGKLDEAALFEAARWMVRDPKPRGLRFYYAVLSSPELRGNFSESIIREAQEVGTLAFDPYELPAMFHPELTHRLRDVLRFHQILRMPGPTQAADLDAWIDSQAKAIFAYQQFSRFGERQETILRYLRARNPFYQETLEIRGVPGALVTLSFDKESFNVERMLAMYRPTEISEAEWSAMPLDKRLALLASRAPDEKEWTPASQLVPSSEKPWAVGRLGHEVGNALEVAHHSFDIDPRAFVEHMQEVQSQTKDRQGFHVHVVTEVPEDYEQVEKFSHWVDQLNAYVLFEGLEANLAPGPLHLPRGVVPQPTLRQKLLKMLDAYPALHHAAQGAHHSLAFTQKLPTKMSELFRHAHKVLFVAPRTIYGPSNQTGFTRLGVELRDSASTIPDWEKLITKVSRAMADKSWEGRDLTAVDPSRILMPRDASRADLTKLANVLNSPELAAMIGEASPIMAVTLVNYEDGIYFDYAQGRYFEPTPEQKARLVEARERFLAELRKIGPSLSRVNNYQLRADINPLFVRWAKESGVSALYGHLGPTP